MWIVTLAIARFWSLLKKENINPRPKGWGNSTPEDSTMEKIIQQGKKCPSRAVSYFMDQEASGIAGSFF